MVNNFQKYIFNSRTQLDSAVNAWTSNESTAREIYGDINTWDVSGISDFSNLFQRKSGFNSNISNWDVSNGENFYAMFDWAESFNQDISNWDVSNGLNFNAMFYNAFSFNQDISNWDVSSSRNFQGMFAGARNFNQNIRSWDVSSGINFSAMFSGATAMLENQLFPSTPSISSFDSIPPNAPSFPLTSIESFITPTTTNDNTPTITGTAEAGSLVKLYNGSTLIGSVTTDSNGEFSITSSTLSDGNYSLTATATDAAGNISS